MRSKSFFIILFTVAFATGVFAQSRSFNGLDMSMGNLYKLSNAETRSISPENFTGEKGKGGMATPDPNAPGTRPTPQSPLAI